VNVHDSPYNGQTIPCQVPGGHEAVLAEPVRHAAPARMRCSPPVTVQVKQIPRSLRMLDDQRKRDIAAGLVRR